MRKLQLIALLFFLSLTAGAGETQAEGFFSRFRRNVSRSATPTRQYTQPARTYPTRNLNQGRSRLPAGRSYYQGRYYGNFNNRFYGPQYGYF